MGIVITCLICCTVFLSILCITEKGITIHITHQVIEPEMPIAPLDGTQAAKTTLDAVLAEINDAFGISVETEEDRNNG